MKTTATEFIYQDTKIHFAFELDGNVMVNATEMAKVFNKRVDFFMKTDQTKRFINQLLSTPFGGNKTPLKMEEIVFANKKAGTYMHRILALKFAAWLDVEFELWVFSTIDELMFGEYRVQEKALEETLKAEKEMEIVISKLYENEDFQRLQTLQNLVKKNNSAKIKAQKLKKVQIRMKL
ncbi:KilA-N domain-containing protein [Tenacibaculum piscium]|uniref:KilA-N domain-containing protein n=1 Tax=Tenacibaculum piscium TaxID=1458515 RepID=UPI0023B9BF83|nr:KilA-N domain-containing protein [Tenacibaculum piscium]